VRRALSHESRTTWPALPAAAVVRDFNVGVKSTRYATSGKFLNCSYDSLRFHCCRCARPLQGLMALNCVYVCVCVCVCVCLGSGTAMKCWRRPMTADVQQNMGEVDDAQNVGRKI
jgi:hypothetical protein